MKWVVRLENAMENGATKHDSPKKKENKRPSQKISGAEPMGN